MSSCSRSKAAGSSRTFFSHQMRSVNPDSSTRNLSLADRPVWGAVTAVNAPQSVREPSPRAECVLDQRRGGQIRVNPDGKKAVLYEGEVLSLNGCVGGHTLPLTLSAKDQCSDCLGQPQ